LDKRKQDNHHIIPLSRLSKGGRKRKNNIVVVDKHRHAIFHELVSNRTPEEVIEMLNEEFFGGKYEIILRRKKE